MTNRFALSQASQKATLIKVIRYLRYYPVNLYWIVQFFVRHSLFKIVQKDNTDQTFVRNLYRFFLKQQDCEESEIEFFLKQLENGSIDRMTLLSSFLMMPASLEQKLFKTLGLISHHQARLHLVQTELPAADLILDLGGAAGDNPAGSLIGMGYPYQPKRIDIIDLPNEERFVKASSAHDQNFYVTPQGTEVHYHYTSMTHLDAFADGTFDLVWSGQSIEHITPNEAEIVIQQAHRVLKPGGYFCLDTPNRRLTLLQVQQGFVHPEHKIEYCPDQLIQTITKAGFAVVKQQAVSPMPISDRIGRFNRLELIHSTSLGDDSKVGYSFYLKCQKLP